MPEKLFFGICRPQSDTLDLIRQAMEKASFDLEPGGSMRAGRFYREATYVRSQSLKDYCADQAKHPTRRCEDGSLLIPIEYNPWVTDVIHFTVHTQQAGFGNCKSTIIVAAARWFEGSGGLRRPARGPLDAHRDTLLTQVDSIFNAAFAKKD